MPRAIESVLVLLFIASLALLVPELPAIANTLGGTELVLRAALSGLVLSAVPVYLLIRADWWLELARLERAAAVFTAALSLVLLSVSTASLLNRAGSAGELAPRTVRVTEGGCGNSSCYVYVKTDDGRSERLELTRPRAMLVTPGEKAVLMVHPGRLGYPHVTELRLAAQRVELGTTYSSRLVETAALLTSAVVVSACVSLVWAGALGWLRRRHPPSAGRKPASAVLEPDTLGAKRAPSVPPEATER
jgi:hypothetical protein